MFDYIFHVLYRNHVEENKTVPVKFIESLFSVNFGRFEQTFGREPLVPNIMRKFDNYQDSVGNQQNTSTVAPL